MTDGGLVVLTPEQLRELVEEAVASALETHAPQVSDVLDRHAAAELLGVSLVTLRKLVLDGLVPERRLGDSPRYIRAELLASLRGPARPAGTHASKTAGNQGEDEGEHGHSVRRILSGGPSVRNR